MARIAGRIKRRWCREERVFLNASSVPLTFNYSFKLARQNARVWGGKGTRRKEKENEASDRKLASYPQRAFCKLLSRLRIYYRGRLHWSVAITTAFLSITSRRAAPANRNVYLPSASFQKLCFPLYHPGRPFHFGLNTEHPLTITHLQSYSS